MKKSKRLICMAVAATLTLGVASAGLAGCISVNNEEDVKQVVATVDITKNEEFNKEFEGYASAVTEKKFVKRDMLTAFINGGYQYAGNNGYAYAFNLIKDSLVSNAIYTQYATAYVLRDRVENGYGEDKTKLSLDTFKSKETEVEKYEYLLGGENSDGVKHAKYTLNYSLNNMLDSIERGLIKEEEKKEDYVGSGTRTTPKGIDSIDDDYIPEYYNVYTGYTGYQLDDESIKKAIDNGDYEPLDNTDKNTRRKAYSDLVGQLKGNFVLTSADVETTDIWELTYVKNEYVSQLQREIINEFTDLCEKEQEEIFKKTEGNVYSYVQGLYDKAVQSQTKGYATTANFESAMGNLSDTEFILYSPATDDTENVGGEYGKFGYVYNILLPFSTAQNDKLSYWQDLRDSELISESRYFIERNKILKDIQTTDQREAWFNGATDYSFDVTEYNKDKEEDAKLSYFAHTKNEGDESHDYLFFENNLTKTDKYEKLEKYVGKYSYNGKVTKNKNGSYNLVANKLGIDGMLAEFEAYVNYVLGSDKVDYSVVADYYGEDRVFTKDGDDKEIDYSKLVYASGKVNVDTAKSDMFVETTDRYKAMAAVNELQYAYTTDTGVLSQYIGYTVSAYTTSYIKEFEYAAQQAVREGVGSFKVCAGDYGWHLIYVTETFEAEGGAAFGDVSFTVDRVEAEGTFENRYYNWLKDSEISKEASLRQQKILRLYNTSEAVKVYESAYKDLTEIVG
ncbi:MAG: hypothetical protein K2K39_00695 [Clostridia bacterium]|nr:hypothetical protein [Clostridia bacterium]